MAKKCENDSHKENVNPKRKCLSLSKKKNKDRFCSISAEELEGMAKYKMPKNSAVSSRWAMKNFHEWFKDYNRKNADKLCPEDLLLPTCSPELLNKWLCVYVTETRNQAGDPYPPRSIYALLCGILREMRVQEPNYPNFLEKSNPVFSQFHITLDNLFKSLRSDGVGASSSHTEGISSKEEKLLWSSGGLNLTTPKGLLHATFY